MLGEVIAIIFIALAIGAIFFYGFKRTGPWGSFWSFILILFLGVWLVDIWVEPYGPVYWGVAWLDLLFIGLLLAFLLAAATPTRYGPPRNHENTDEELVRASKSETRGAVALGLFFWLMLLMFMVLLLLGLFAE